ncbi:MAG: histidinol-phosphate transaminase [Pseudomonadota bacterium]
MAPTSRAGDWVRPAVRELTAYRVADADGLVKLDAMENPWPWPEELRAPWLEALGEVAVNRYPDAAARELRTALRDGLAPPAGTELLLGNGSDEIIQIIIEALAGPDRTVVTPEPGFAMYRILAEALGMRYVGVPLRTTDFGLDRAAMLAAIAEHQPALVFLAYPNNPTGNLFDADAIAAILDAAPGLVVIDEAYHAFAGRSWLGALADHPDLVVLRTLSKTGLAGLRLGFAIGHPDWLAEFEKLRLPYNINSLTQVSARFALTHWAPFERQAEAIRAERARLHDALTARPGLTVHPSAANFILFRTPAARARAVFEHLRDRGGVLIKDLSGAGGTLTDCLRVTVGTPEENDRFLAALDAALAAD